MATQQELEELLASDEKGEPVHIRPDGTIGEPETWGGRAYRLADQLRSHLSTQPSTSPTPGEIEMMIEELDPSRVTRCDDGTLRTYYSGYDLTAIAEHISRELAQR